MESCGMSCIKFLLIVFNGLFIIFGIIIISVAAIDLGTLKDYGGEEAAVSPEVDVLLIVVGVLIIAVAAFGCFGAWVENRKLLFIFVACLLVIILFELSVGIAAAALRPRVEEGMKTHLRDSFIKNKSSSSNDELHRRFWNKIQASNETPSSTLRSQQQKSKFREINNIERNNSPNEVTS